MKKISTISVFVSTVALAGLCSCSSNSSKDQSAQSSQATTTTTTTTTQTTQQAPPPKPKKQKDKRPIEERLVVGMTMDQVKAACGNPKEMAMNSDGSATWIYNNGQNAFIPYYSETGHKIHHVTIFFDNNGKVKSWSTADTGMY